MWAGAVPSPATVESHVFRLRRYLEPDRERGTPVRKCRHALS
jgi:hypothetical protein